MIVLSFTTGERDTITYLIEGKTVVYKDKNWKNGLKIAPMSQQLVTYLQNSRSQMLRQYADLVIGWNSDEEYINAKDEKELAEIIRKACAINGLVEA